MPSHEINEARAAILKVTMEITKKLSKGVQNDSISDRPHKSTVLDTSHRLAGICSITGQQFSHGTFFLVSFRLTHPAPWQSTWWADREPRAWKLLLPCNQNSSAAHLADCCRVGLPTPWLPISPPGSLRKSFPAAPKVLAQPECPSPSVQQTTE